MGALQRMESKKRMFGGDFLVTAVSPQQFLDTYSIFISPQRGNTNE
jgi:hypothetical protein